MKKLITLLAFISCTAFAHAQITLPNNSFENLGSNGSPNNWWKTYLLPITIDTTGKVDSVLIDSAFYFASTDAHTGMYAMEMRNMYNFTKGFGIAGAVVLNTDEQPYTGFGAPFHISDYPTELSFFYKYFPVNNDSAEISVMVYDEFDQLLGTGQLKIGGSHSMYEEGKVSVNYFAQGTPSYLSIYFSASAYNPEPSYGTRLLIDDVSLKSTSVGVNSEKNIEVKAYPNPVLDQLTIQASEKINRVELKDILGKSIYCSDENINNIDCKNLVSGVYLLNVYTDKGEKVIRVVR